ncbi:nucleoside diphosphate kinase 2, chloroplastic [Oryza brachyantha]|uniref:nucleoside diphosphate kinase 2, chloroplastic n=1 Tax=Oryza brachyantha TaxID=4533 RepID=UPI001ADB50D6|nr:nucleoside diphosphate kinase 2, chloroplastic [Oryza brachyantha]
MDAMAVLARTARPAAPTLAAAAAPRLPASLSFAASSGPRGRVALSAGWGGRAARARVSAGRIVASSVEQSYIMIKPDGVQRCLVGEIISRFEKKGFVLKGLKLFQCPKELAQEHYKDLKDKPFFPSLIEYITSGPVVCMAWEGDGVVASARKLIGATNPLQAEPGTIRGDLAVQTGRNVVHGSDSPDNGKREIALWFKETELCEWESVQTPWLIE